MPNPELIGKTYYLRVRVPKDVAEAARGTKVAVPVGDRVSTVSVKDVVKVSLRTSDAAEAKRRFTHALAAVEAHWAALKKGPVALNHKQCVALAGEIRRDWVAAFDEEPGSPSGWMLVQELDADAAQLTQNPFERLAVRAAVKPPNSKGLEARFGGFADVVLRRHGLIVDAATRVRLLPLIASAMSEAAEVNLSKSQGDYSDSGDTAKYPAFGPKQTATDERQRDEKKPLTFGRIIDEEERRRSLGRDGKPIPPTTIRKYRLASKEFADFRGGDNARTVTPEDVEGWKLNMLEEGELSNSTIAQRLQNISTVMEWGQQHELGKLFLHSNPVNVVKRPEKHGVRSENRTLRLTEARAILRAARQETKPTLRWLPWMMAYSGARVGEVAQLCAQDFFAVEGQWFFVLTTKGRKTLKNEQSIRKVPLHPDLITEGLLEFVQGRSGDPSSKLFKRSSQQDLSAWVRGTVGVTREEAAPNHGWRHLFEDMALDAEMTGAAKLYITGRASGGSADGYGKSDAMLPGLAREMQKIRSYL
ncbi:Hypothetical Cytosolic Protein [Roseobacter sp. MED193]|uniref:DUF6538 domain-containing protein n=1 Tax=Roseobacter sp. MED193 TaxID=314262 RepID=UPI000068B767|nr:DUF6538 domain-containing protein [Roseobacter sp. MED193]EAQ47714.1 Hypothetical Cytosolic Protein [Roseobacter sp. MED193]